MKKLNKILIIIIVMLLFIIGGLLYYIFQNRTNYLKEALSGYEDSVILKEAGIEITSDNDGFYKVINKNTGDIIRENFKINMLNNTGEYEVINR